MCILKTCTSEELNTQVSAGSCSLPNTVAAHAAGACEEREDRLLTSRVNWGCLENILLVCNRSLGERSP
eukprot:143016-Amphidinium_carterae.3